MNRRFCASVLWGLALGVLGAATAAPAAESEPIRIVVMNVGASDAALQSLANALAEQILTELSRTKRIEAMGTSDVSAVLGLERQKEMLGCSDQGTSCLAEISAAMGAPYLVTGHLARAGKATRIDIKLIRASDGKAIHRDGRNFRDESEMFDLVGAMVKSLVAELQATDGVRAQPQARTQAQPPTPADSGTARRDAPLATAAASAGPPTPVPESAAAAPSAAPPSKPLGATLPTHQGSTNPYLLPLGLGVGGGLVAIAGGITWGVSLAVGEAAASDFQARIGSGTIVTVNEIRAAERQANGRVLAGIVMTGVGVAVAGTGMGLLYRRLAGPQTPATSMTVSAVPLGREGGLLLLGGAL